MSEHSNGGRPDDHLEELRKQIRDDLAPVRENREVFERAADGDIDGVGEDGAAIARVWLAVLDGVQPDPEDVATMDAYGKRDDEGQRIKRMLADADAEASSDPRAWAPERRWSAVRGVARRFGIDHADIEASYGRERGR